jgi:hypothetical protein
MSDDKHQFPWRCCDCGRDEVFKDTILDYPATAKHSGRLYSFVVPQLTVGKCRKCGEVLFSNVTDDQIEAAFQEHLAKVTR